MNELSKNKSTDSKTTNYKSKLDAIAIAKKRYYGYGWNKQFKTQLSRLLN